MQLKCYETILFHLSSMCSSNYCVAIGKFGEHLTEELQLLSAVLWEMLLHLLLPSNFPWASNLSQSNNFYVIRIIIVDVLGGTGFGHQGWINYVCKILVCEVWNTLTLKKIVWVSGKWMFFFIWDWIFVEWELWLQ